MKKFIVLIASLMIGTLSFAMEEPDPEHLKLSAKRKCVREQKLLDLPDVLSLLIVVPLAKVSKIPDFVNMLFVSKCWYKKLKNLPQESPFYGVKLYGPLRDIKKFRLGPFGDLSYPLAVGSQVKSTHDKDEYH